MDRVNWSSLVRNIDKSRSGKARFFKPVCVIAAIDLAGEGRLDPNDIDADAILNRFADYVTPFFRERGNDGFQPLWHLSNNHLWTFFKDGRALTSKEFAGGKPGTKAKLSTRFDRMAISEDLRKLWQSPPDRRALRDAMLLMLENSDRDSRRLVAPLFNPQHLVDESRWPDRAVLDAFFAKLTDQQFLFDENALEAAPPIWDPSARSLQATDFSTGASTSLSAAPSAIENVPSAVDYVWTNDRIVVGRNQASLPVFPFASSERDHVRRLEACATQAADLLRDLQGQRWQVRDDFGVEIKRYLDRLPKEIGTGNILLADAAARILRDMFAAEQSILPSPFAAKLKVLLQQNIALRPFYPEIDDFYRAVKTGRIDRPLPLDAVNNVKEIVRGQTPTVFDASVSNAIGEASASEPEITLAEDGAQNDGEAIAPPPDPVGELDHRSAHDFQVAGVLNRLWKVFTSAEKVHSSTTAWIETFHSLSDPMKPILDWLHHFLER
jgi:hypothetical protein